MDRISGLGGFTGFFGEAHAKALRHERGENFELRDTAEVGWPQRGRTLNAERLKLAERWGAERRGTTNVTKDTNGSLVEVDKRMRTGEWGIRIFGDRIGGRLTRRH